MKKSKVILWILGTLLAGLIIAGCNLSPKASISEERGTSKQKKNYPELGQVAYIQKGNLWVKTLPDGSAEQITTDGSVSSPRWSISGKWLLFQKKDQLWIIGADGSNRRLVADNVQSLLKGSSLQCGNPEVPEVYIN